jgi:hypothetical protein
MPALHMAAHLFAKHEPGLLFFQALLVELFHRAFWNFQDACVGCAQPGTAATSPFVTSDNKAYTWPSAALNGSTMHAASEYSMWALD